MQRAQKVHYQRVGIKRERIYDSDRLANRFLITQQKKRKTDLLFSSSFMKFANLLQTFFVRLVECQQIRCLQQWKNHNSKKERGGNC